MKHPQEHHNYSAEVVDEIDGNDKGEEVTEGKLVSNAVDQLETMKCKVFQKKNAQLKLMFLLWRFF